MSSFIHYQLVSVDRVIGAAFLRRWEGNPYFLVDVRPHAMTAGMAVSIVPPEMEIARLICAPGSKPSTYHFGP